MLTLAITPILTLCAATLVAGAALVLSFVPRLPAALCAFVALVISHFSGLTIYGGQDLAFWGIASAIVAAISVVSWRDKAPAYARAVQAYMAGGALVGAAIGLALTTMAAVIVASAVGAFMGLEAFRRTPRGRECVSLKPLDVMAAIGLPLVINDSIIMLILSQLLS